MLDFKAKDTVRSVAADILRRACRWRALERKKISLLNLLVMILLFGSVGTESVAAQEEAIPEMSPAAKQVAGSIEEALATFVTAFDDLDWPVFRACFSARPTIFHPAAPNIKRIDTPEQFENAWSGVFARIKENSGRTSPPYMHLVPQDLRIEKLSDDVALVTFHLIDGRIVSRRTLVMKRQSAGWKIVHVHASNIEAP